jgi:asparagine synthase (glutamine-hydrolysing)
MCGIAGIYGGDVETVRRMNEAQRWRGPDDEGVWADDHVALGHVRLSIVGSARRGHEPLVGPDGQVLIMNGELFSPGPVMAALGLPFAPDDTDASALSALLRAEGPSGLAHVSGFFAAATYDPRRRALLLVRDTWGQKPLYLARTAAGARVFASSIGALRAAVGPLRVRPAAVHEYLVYRSVGGCHSMFEGVEQLPPGTWLEVTPEGERRGRWFVPPAPERGPSPDLACKVRERLEAAVAERMSDTFEVGVYLSGGLDSSLVATILGRRFADRRVRTWSIGYDVEGIQDERSLASRLSEHLPFPHEEIVLESGRVPELMAEVSRYLEDPIQDPVTLPTLLLARAAGAHTRVVLTGDGSDEFWGGYARFDEVPARLEEYWPRTAIFQPHELGLEEAPASYRDDVPLPEEGMDPLDRVLRWECSNRLRNYHLMRIDKLNMAACVEARSPFLDRALTRFALSIPATVKRPDGRAKGLLVDAFRDTLPDWLVERKKQPFSVPIAAWLRGPLRDWARDTLLGSDAFTRGYIDARPWLEAEDEGAAMRLWSLLQLEAWSRAVRRPLEAA